MNKQTIKDIKLFAIIGLVVAVVVLLGAIIGLKRTLNRQNYAIENNCQWV